jgi:site-specific DNA recombinase
MFDEIQQAGARLEFVTERFEDTAVGRFILAARAFVGEVEREKMSERTTRGKIERARSGRMPQGFGRGCYGYVYQPKLGRREIEPFQAEVVRRIFARYAETRSFDRVSYELNQDGITAFDGGRWYPITIRRLLKNESYAGRLIYRRSRWIKTRGLDGKMHRRQVERPIDDQIEIVGASPQIVEEALWQRVQAIIEDPERVRRAPTPARTYELRGRMKCGACGASMVGQTLKIEGKAYPYYRCRHAYDRRNGRHCETRYVRALDLEGAVWREVAAVLTRPTVVLDELERAREADPQSDHAEERERLESEITSIKDREKRLVRLYTFGEIDDDTVRNEGAELRRRRQVLEERLATLMPAPTPSTAAIDRAMLDRACAVVADWLKEAGTEGRMLALEALQVAVTTTRESATVSGVLPVEPPTFITQEQSSRCTLPGK